MIIVCPLNKAHALIDEHGASHAVSLLSNETPHPVFDALPPANHLRLTFHDIIQPMDGMSPPRAADAERLIAFLSSWEREAPMLIHCWAGISRSTAAAFTAMCLFRPGEDEEALALELREASPSATPNRLIVSFTDQLLGRQGRMVRAVEKIGRGAEAFEGVPFRVRI
jgi:predicted protein tyrosine phosphatase